MPDHLNYFEAHTLARQVRQSGHFEVAAIGTSHFNPGRDLVRLEAAKCINGCEMKNGPGCFAKPRRSNNPGRFGQFAWLIKPLRPPWPQPVWRIICGWWHVKFPAIRIDSPSFGGWNYTVILMPKIERALISVFDKTGLIPFAETLAAAGVEIISTGGTAKALKEKGIQVIELSAHTGFPEMLDGRVKTLHPKIHGGLLYLRDNPEHVATAKEHGIKPIDLVVVNLYPFEQTVARPNVTLEEAIENIDIGGPSMLRSAAKNHESVTVIINPGDYSEVAEQIISSGGTTLELRRKLAARVFARTSAYDAAIAAHLIKTFGNSSFATAMRSTDSAKVQEPGYAGRFEGQRLPGSAFALW